ncbi:CD3e molecule, epsilon associated protein [Phyllopteryx taeniolatus]|uniref:CD3e molecule, epsilon associated protein n=1 Tax=Phyllopteryx taeniolatus TaxID=161469 RepID=UPI002AD379CC|nr:CD3e molecule, epsilon associated protein [Phyllopteryx taeniolatus]XP_061639292.1 CD3e molecule, epsilon associated protein [Phyllopteryx taeniolatus]
MTTFETSSRQSSNVLKMHRDISPSSSSSGEDDDGDGDGDDAGKPLKAKEMAKGETSKYECPDDFVSSRSPLTDLLKGNESEVWLVKTPAGFEPRSLHGVEVNLCGFQTLTLPSAGDASDGQPVYNVLASNHGTSDLRLLTAGSGAAFCGLLSVYESYGSAGTPPPVARAAPAPTIPPGLKQRFRPFGSETPITTRETRDQDGKTKKKKKDERIKAEPEDLEVTVKQEVEEPGQEHWEDKRRKKRKKKDREEKEKEELVQVKQEVESEQEVVDACYKNDGSAKKKKKKKEKKIRKDND